MFGFLIVNVFLCVDRPEPPTNLELSDPYERSVRLSWVPGDSNHNPITGKRQLCLRNSCCIYQTFLAIFLHSLLCYRVLSAV